MAAIVVVGGQWGDEGKGRIVDHLAKQAQVVVRYSGGNNAGHTVINDGGTFDLHLVPAGIFYPAVRSVIGNGVVVDPEALLNEMQMLEERGVSLEGLVISDRAHLVMPYHKTLDRLQEQSWGDWSIGSTMRGIGPAYTDKAARLGIRMAELLDEEAFRDRLAFVLAEKNRLLTQMYGEAPMDFEEVFSRYWSLGQRLARYIKPTERLVQEAAAAQRTIVLEGAQGTLLDPDYGTYPYVTSSHPTAGGAATGSGLAPTQIDRVMGVFKAYCTRVGDGPLPTELHNEIGERLRTLAHEYGVTTGRPRRCGWFDGVIGRYSVQINGMTAVALTRLDILDTFSEIGIGVAYELNGQRLDYPPSNVAEMERCRPIYEMAPGWLTPITACRRFEDLPPAAQQYVTRLEQVLGCPVALISVGPQREEIIVRQAVL